VQALRVGSGCPECGFTGKVGPDQQLDVHLLPFTLLLAEAREPEDEMVDPARDAVLVEADALGQERPLPLVVG
jgi:hypothetical protein